MEMFKARSSRRIFTRFSCGLQSCRGIPCTIFFLFSKTAWLTSGSIWSSSQLFQSLFPLLCITQHTSQCGASLVGSFSTAVGWTSLLFNLITFSLCLEPNSEIPASSCISLTHYFIDHLNNLIPELPHSIPTSPTISQVSWVKFLAAQRGLEQAMQDLISSLFPLQHIEVF